MKTGNSKKRKKDEYTEGEVEDNWDDDYYDEDDIYDGLNEEDIEFLNKIKKPKHALHPLYKKFLNCKDIISNREITLYDILSCNITDEKRSNLVEKLECLRHIEPHTSDYIEARDQLRNLFLKYTIIDTQSMPAPLNINLSNGFVSIKPSTPNESESSVFKRKIQNLTCNENNRKMLEEKLDEFEESMKGEEKNKLKRWLTAALNLPFDKIVENIKIKKQKEEKKEEKKVKKGKSFIKDRDNIKDCIKEIFKENIETEKEIEKSENDKETKEKETKEKEIKESEKDKEITLKVKSAQEYLNKKLYGMKNVKERLLLFLNKKLREASSRGCNIALLGKPGVGKCLHPETGIIMHDLSIKKAKDIVEGDLLLGDDQLPRLVLSTVRGKEEMFAISQNFGETYVVNKSHILTLYRLKDNNVVDIPLVDVLNKEKEYRPFYCGYIGLKEEDEIAYVIGKNLTCPVSKTTMNPFIPNDALHWSISTKLKFLYGLIDGSEISSSNDNVTSIFVPAGRLQFVDSILNVIRSLGMRCIFNKPFIVINYCQKEDFKIESIGEGEYCGFTINGNERFVLADWTVTHNTAIAKSLAECLDLPFAQVSFGGVTHPDFLMGHDYTYVGSRPGEISRCLSRMGTKNGILFFDEFDKATDKKEIMSTLLHITDFSQNNEFRDNYFPELTQDLSKLWFIYSMNQLPNDPAMLDRLEVIHVDEYTLEERKAICINYLFPKYLKELNIQDKVEVTEEGVKKIIDIANGTKDRKGVRDLERCINLVTEKIYFYLNNKDDKQYEDEYPWYKKMMIKDGKVVVSKQLCETILAFCRKEEVYVNMYM